MLSIGLFRALTWKVDDLPQTLAGKPAELLALIALEHAEGKPALRTRLAGLLFPDVTESNARRLLNNMLYRLRQSLGEAQVHLEATVEVIQLVDASSDLLVLRAALQAGDPATLADALQQSPDALCAEFDGEWALEARATLRSRILQMLPRATASAGPVRAIPLLHAWLRLDPTDEAACAKAMRFHAQAGQPADALALFAATKMALVRELDQDPGPELQALADAIHAERSASVAPPPVFVGRQAERAQLIRWLEEPAGPPLLLLDGDPGIGKTALGDAFAEAARWRGWQVAIGRGSQHGHPSLAAPLPGALGPLLHAALRAQLQADLGKTSADLLFGVIDGAGTPAMTDGWRETPVVLDALLLHTLQALAVSAPLLIWLDDAHWADPLLWPVLAQLAQNANARLRFLLCARGRDLRDTAPAWDQLRALDAEGQLHTLGLRGLDAASTGALAAALGHAVDARDLPALQTATGGNPLVLRAQLRGGPQRNIQVGAMYATALDKLSPEALAALKLAALAGPSVSHEVWQRAQGGPVPAAALIAAGLLRVTNDGYALEHDLLRVEVVTRTPAGERAAMHIRLAHAFDGGSSASTQAGHFEAGGAWLEATRSYMAAVAQARRLSAPAAIEALLVDAERCSAHLPERATERLQVRTLRLLNAQATTWTAQQAAEAEALAQAAEAQLDLRVMVELRMAQMRHAGGQSRFEDAQAFQMRAQGAAEELGDTATALLVANGHWRMRAQMQLQHEQDVAAIDADVKRARELGKIEALIALLLTQAYVMHRLDRLRECEACLDEVDALHLAHPTVPMEDIPRLRTRALVIAALHNDREKAREVQVHLLSRARLQGDYGALRNSLISLLTIDTILGQLESTVVWGEEMLRESVRRAGAEHPSTQISRAFLAGALLEVDETTRAWEIIAPLQRWLEAAPRDGFPAFLGWIAVANGRRENLEYAGAALCMRKVLALPVTQGTLASVPMLLLADDLQQSGAQDEPVAMLDAARPLIDTTRPSDEFILLNWVEYRVRGTALALAHCRNTLFELMLGIRSPKFRRDALVRRRFVTLIHQAFARLPQPRRERVPLADAHGAMQHVMWTVDDGLSDAQLQGAALRAHRLKRLSLEANMQGVAPTFAALAAALRVSTRTVERDIAVLEAAGVHLHTLKRAQALGR